jgi:hypothetical protein
MFIRVADRNVWQVTALLRAISGLTADSKGAISTQMPERYVNTVTDPFGTQPQICGSDPMRNG